MNLSNYIGLIINIFKDLSLGATLARKRRASEGPPCNGVRKMIPKFNAMKWSRIWNELFILSPEIKMRTQTCPPKLALDVGG